MPLRRQRESAQDLDRLEVADASAAVAPPAATPSQATEGWLDVGPSDWILSDLSPGFLD